MSDLQTEVLKRLRTRAGSLQNGNKGDMDVVSEVVGDMAILICDLYDRQGARRRFWRNHWQNLLSLLIAIGALVVSCVKLK